MTYESWRITFQSSEQAARAAFYRCAELGAEICRLQSEVNSLALQNKYLSGSRSNIEVVAENVRIKSEVTALRLYAPARRAQPTVKTAPIAPPNLAFFGIAETDEEFAERAGRKVDGVAG